MTAEQRKALDKVRKCLALAADVRGNKDERETAWRQAQALIARHGLELEKLMPAAAPAAPAAAPARPTMASAEWAPYWAQRNTAEALQAGLRAPVLCSDGWAVPG